MSLLFLICDHHWAEQHISSGLASVLFATMPFYTAILANYFIVNDRLTFTKLTGIMIGFIGIIYLFKGSMAIYGKTGFFAMALTVLSPLFSAVGTIIHKKKLTSLEPIQLAGWQMSIAGVLLLVPALIGEGISNSKFTLPAMAALFYLSIFGSAVAFVAYYRLLKEEDAKRVSMIAFIIPPVAVITGHIAAGEPLSAEIFAGGSLVVVEWPL